MFKSCECVKIVRIIMFRFMSDLSEGQIFTDIVMFITVSEVQNQSALLEIH